MKTTVKLAGFRELDRALSELPKATGKNVLRRVAKGALEPMADRAAALAPEETGKLAFSIIVSEKRTRRAKGKSKTRFSGGRFITDASTGIEMAMGPASGTGVLQYATFVEFGTVDTPAHPFMRPAWAAGAEPALDYIKANLGSEIDKAASRLAKKRARAGA